VFVQVPNRSAETLMGENQKFVLPGTEIWTDEWAAYRQLKNLRRVSPYTWKTVNHSRFLVDPTTGACTNQVEGYWSRFKRWARETNVLASPIIDTHIDAFVWREMFAQNGGAQTFKNLLSHIRMKYRV